MGLFTTLVCEKDTYVDSSGNVVANAGEVDKLPFNEWIYQDFLNMDFTPEEADAIEWVIKEHNNFCRVAKEKKSLALVHHPNFKLLCETARADAMQVNREFYLERIESFKSGKISKEEFEERKKEILDE